VNGSPVYSYFKYYVHDHLYSPVALTNSAGSVEERYEYDAYGNCYVLEPNFADDPDGKSDYGNPYYFTGRRLDTLDAGSLKIMYYRHRYYDTYTGRFATHDPLGYVDGVNLYEYVSGNPITYTDPWGFGEYRIGSELPPAPPHDVGAGAHGADGRATVRDWVYWGIWFNIASQPLVRLVVPDAARHMRHYLGNTGKALEVRVGKMVNQSQKAKRHFYKELNDAMAFVEENVECGKTEPIVGTWTGGGTDDSRNWFYAVGGYSACGSGTVTNLGNRGTGKCKYKLEFTFHFDDRYNWDTGKGVNILGIRISDESLGRLHRVGIAKEFDMTGSTSKTVTWEKGQRFDEEGSLRPPSRRRWPHWR